MEINAAYAVIKSSLAGSSLYRTSLKGEEIILSFISSQVGARHQAQIDTLTRQTGWQMSINTNPNQGAIQEAARLLADRAGWKIAKGPSIFLDTRLVTIALAEPPKPNVLAQVTAEFNQQTGFQLHVTFAGAAPVQQPAASQAASAAPVVEIPITSIRLRPHQQAIQLNPEKLLKTIERARRDGISPPIQVRRLRDGYLLEDGLYRLKAAEALGLNRLPATIQ
jgi:hypothetical protein